MLLLGAGAPALAQHPAPPPEGLRLDGGGPGFTVVVPLGTGGVGRRGRLEIAAVVLTGAAHLGASRRGASRVFIPLAVAGWGGYLAYRAHTEPGYLGRAGFTRRRLAPAFRDASVGAAAALAAMAGVGWAQGTLRLHRDLLPLMLLYPAWGLVQQGLVQHLVAGNLQRARGWAGHPAFVVPTSAALFGSVHLPNLRLTAATTALGLVYTPLYLRHGNLWPLGLYHGWLGALFYFWVLDRNPWRYVAP